MDIANNTAAVGMNIIIGIYVIKYKPAMNHNYTKNWIEIITNPSVS